MRCVAHMKDMRIVGRPRNGMQDSWVFRDVLLRGLDSFWLFQDDRSLIHSRTMNARTCGTTSQQSFRTGVCWGINGPQGCGWGAQNGTVSLTRPYLWQIWCFVRSQKYQTLRKRKVHDLDTFFADNLEHHLTAKFLFPISLYFHQLTDASASNARCVSKRQLLPKGPWRCFMISKDMR